MKHTHTISARDQIPMDYPGRVKTIFYLAVTVTGLILLSMSLARLEFQPGQTFPFGPLAGSDNTASAGDAGVSLAGNLLSWWTILAVSAFFLLIVLWLLVFILRPEVRKYLLSRLISYLLLLLLISGLLYSLQEPLSNLEPEEAANQSQSFLPGELPSEPRPSPPAIVVDPPGWLVAGVTLVFATLGLGLGWWLWTRRPRRQVSPREQIALQARTAAQAISSGRDLKDTVMHCYRQMTQILAAQQNLHRATGMTPREFEQYLADSGLADVHIRRLTRLFESVRYGAAAPSNAEEQEAMACLNAIVQEYAPS
jgi:hypothetical protein